MTRAPLLQRIHRDRSGATIIEFALVAPVLLMMLMAMFDIAYTLYMQASLQGVVQKAARDATLQNNLTATAQATLDAKITAQVQAINSGAKVTPTRLFYKDYADAATQFEPFSDADKDGKCDHNETYTDINGNGTWDSQLGTSTGGAQDKTLYTVTVTYPRLFPMAAMLGWSSTVTLVAKTVLAVQPYADQSGVILSPKTLFCP